MKLPILRLTQTEWSQKHLDSWNNLAANAGAMSDKAGKSDVFERVAQQLRNMASTGQFEGLPELLKRRVTARALSWLWLSNDDQGNRLLTPQLLKALLKAQAPRLTRITLQQLTQLYFRRFDHLDEREGLKALLEQCLQEQLEKLPLTRLAHSYANPLNTLKEQGHWLLTSEGPKILAEQVQEKGIELADTFSVLGLQGYDDGRFGDICRAHFYLETLRNLSVGKWSPVMNELLKPSVNKAPFEGNRRIGHAALEILIDRSGLEPSNTWQDFIIQLAGDPRITSTASNYREWWQPLGTERIQRVRGWLSKEDLRLFLQAVEQYGIESNNQELQRMFPARKRFLEGLFKLKLIRGTRLLLGTRARQSVRHILGKEVQTNFARMDGQMNDKAVIYLDCGDFHLVEGSHSFMIWVYLAPPSSSLQSYERNSFTHHELTKNIPAKYQSQYPGLPHAAIRHMPHAWQNHVFAFLANNGIGLDIEQLLDERDYDIQLRRYGVPVVKGSPPKVGALEPTEPQQISTSSFVSEKNKEFSTNSSSNNIKNSTHSDNIASAEHKAVSASLSTDILQHEQSRYRKAPVSQTTSQDEALNNQTGADQHEQTPTERKLATGTLSADLLKRLRSAHGSSTGNPRRDSRSALQPQQAEPLKPEKFSPLHSAILNYLKGKPSSNIHELAAATKLQGGNVSKVTIMLKKEMAPYVHSNSESYWSLSHEGTLAWQALFSTSSTPATAKPKNQDEDNPQKAEEQTSDSYSAATELEMKNLSPISLKILGYFSTNSGDRARNAAKVMNMDTSIINQHLYGPLKNMLIKDDNHGWHLTQTVRNMLNRTKPG
ncbi:EH signature domain-containing protein [Oceanimonas baumannii]|uniref:EH signature domain-containing protein n=1 Tax=Oceanimonas baumannii TaxID=129578 RepID=UPI001D18CE53|nr:EH signature domain-containing protein [Oceanimonas baumannii]MCC4264420.1 EH signature domain-containing protein [Oceanimonas baumannii]